MDRMWTHEELLRRVERHLETSGETATAFSKRVAGDGNLVRQLRAGRSPRLRLVEGIFRAIDGDESEKSANHKPARDAVVAA